MEKITRIVKLTKDEGRRTKDEEKLNRTPILHFLSSIFFLSVLCPLSSVICYAVPVSSSDLINNAKEYDGKEVIYRGEAIGDVMRRGEFAWVNVNDTKDAIGIWLAHDLAEGISYTGSYKTKGDIVEIKGKFNRACALHGGDLDIHAAGLQIIEKGKSVDEAVSAHKIKAAIGFLVICLTLTVIYFIKLGLTRITTNQGTNDHE